MVILPQYGVHHQVARDTKIKMHDLELNPQPLIPVFPPA